MNKFKINQLESLNVFKKVVEYGSFTAAAIALNVSTAWVSMCINRLEVYLGVTLLLRSTRQIQITKEGEYCLSKAIFLLDKWGELEEGLTQSNNRVKGKVVIGIPVSWGLIEFGPIATAFNEIYPEIVLDIQLNDDYVDVLCSKFDLVFRIANQLDDSSLLCQKITSYRRITCATPQYINENGAPQHPEELIQHRSLFYNTNKVRKSWVYLKGKDRYEVALSPSQISNNSQLLHYSLLASQGIALIPEFIVRDDIKQGRLISLFPEFESMPLNLYSLKANGQPVSKRVQLLQDFIYAVFNN